MPHQAGAMMKTLRIAAIAAPALMVGYGICRYVDGRDGDHGPGPAWNIGHTLFLAAFLAFGLLIVGLRRDLRSASTRRTAVANLGTALGLAGVLAFIRVILDDLFPDAGDVLPLPGAVQAVGPLFFLVGLLTLLIDLAVHEPHRLPVWSPVAVLLGFVTITVNLDLLPVAALLFLVGLSPLVRRPSLERARPRPA
jgi:uncharacterized membrane protein